MLLWWEIPGGQIADEGGVESEVCLVVQHLILLANGPVVGEG